MYKIDLETYINITITEEGYKSFKRLGKVSRGGSFSTLKLFFHYLHQQFTRVGGMEKNIINLINPIMVELANRYGLNDYEALNYIGVYFINKKWGKFIPYTTKRRMCRDSIIKI